MRARYLMPLCMLLSGCAVGPDFHTPPPPKTTSYLPPHTLSKQTAGQYFIRGQSIPKTWWSVFHCHALDKLVAQGIALNPSLAETQAKLTEAQYQLAVQFSHLMYPDISGNTSFERNRVNGVSGGNNVGGTSTSALSAPAVTFNIFTAALTGSYMPDIFGLNRRTIEALQAQVDYAKYQWLAAYVTLSTDIVNTVIARAETQAQIDTTRALIAEQQETLAITRSQQKLGGQTELAVTNLATEVAQTEALLPPLYKQLAQDSHALAVLIGNYPSQAKLPMIRLSQLQLPKNLPVSLPSKLTKQRPDIQQAQALLHAASAEIGVATAQMLPQFTITGGYGYSGAKLQNLFTPQTVIWNFIAGLTQPLFNGGALVEYKREKTAAYKAAMDNYNNVVFYAFKNVADSLTNIQSDGQTYLKQRNALLTATQALNITKGQYQLRAVNYLDVLNAQQTYQKARINYLQAKAARYTDTANLYQALGGGWWQ